MAENLNVAIEPENAEPDKTCIYCFQTIIRGAIVCHHCGRSQNKWIERTKVASTLVTIAMILIAGGQVGVSYLQMQDAKLKRVEALDVLEEAKNVLAIAGHDASAIREEAKGVLLKAEAESNKAIEESQLVLKQSKADVALAMISVKEAERKVDDLISSVNSKMSEMHESLLSFKKESDASLNVLNHEVKFLVARNKITRLADEATSQDDAIAYTELFDMLPENEEQRLAGNYDSVISHAVVAELSRIKSNLLTKNYIPIGHDLTINVNGEQKANDQIPTDVLIELLTESDNRLLRAKAAQLLGSRRERMVPEALLESLRRDPNLMVRKYSKMSFSKVTGYKSLSVLNYNRPSQWWKLNKDNFDKKL